MEQEDEIKAPTSPAGAAASFRLLAVVESTYVAELCAPAAVLQLAFGILGAVTPVSSVLSMTQTSDELFICLEVLKEIGAFYARCRTDAQ